MDVVNARISDAEDILKLQKLAYRSEAELHNDFEIPPLTQTLEELISDFKHKRILKVESSEKIIASGQAYLVGDCCHIGRMVVLPAYQGRGIGSMLMATLESTFPKASEYEIFTGEKSSRNLAMYKRRGYIPYNTAILGKTKVIFLRRSRTTPAL